MPKKFASTIAGASILITGIGFLSKGFGFLREIIYANNFGLQTNFDIYLIGAVFPITINTSVFYLAQNYFIPVYSRKLSEDENTANKFLSDSFWLFIVLTLSLAFFLLLVSPFLISSYVTSNDYKVQERALKIFQILLLTIPLNGGFAILSSYFQSHYNFKAPAFSTLFQNIVIIILVLSFTDTIGVFTIPIGYLLGSIAQIMYLIYSMKNRGILKPALISFSFHELGKVEKTFSLIIIIELVNQLYIMVDRYFYGNVDSGGLAALNYASVLFSLPISVFSLALSTAIFPKLTKSLNENNSTMSEFHYLTGLQINIFLFIPITFVLILFGDSIIKLFYQRGSYTVQDTLLTFSILKLYSISLIFYSSYAVINKAIYGAGLVKNLLTISLVVFFIKIALNFLLVSGYKQNGLALATSISYGILSISCYYLILQKLKFKISGFILKGILFYTMNGVLSYLTAITFNNYFLPNSMLSFIFIFLVFVTVYAINIIILKPKEFLIFKETLGKYLIY